MIHPTPAELLQDAQRDKELQELLHVCWLNFVRLPKPVTITKPVKRES